MDRAKNDVSRERLTGLLAECGAEVTAVIDRLDAAEAELETLRSEHLGDRFSDEREIVLFEPLIVELAR